MDRDQQSNATKPPTWWGTRCRHYHSELQPQVLLPALGLPAQALEFACVNSNSDMGYSHSTEIAKTPACTVVHLEHQGWGSDGGDIWYYVVNADLHQLYVEWGAEKNRSWTVVVMRCEPASRQGITRVLTSLGHNAPFCEKSDLLGFWDIGGNLKRILNDCRSYLPEETLRALASRGLW